jgi:formamidopyrimidine-DNA glycosylase
LLVPELPEVETIVRDITPHLTGRTLRNPQLHKTDVLRGISRRRFINSLDGQRVERVSRRAKHAVLLLGNGLRLIIQPRMTGTLIVYDRSLRTAERRYAVLEIKVGRRGTFVYRDVRRLGTIHLLQEKAWLSYTARIGPEPLDDAFDVAKFAARLRGTRQAIKKTLMDQARIAGVGNIYANEVLFRAAIDPSRRTDKIDRHRIGRLYRELREVLGEAIAAQGTTFRDYRTGTGQRGSFQDSLLVYGRAGQPCSECGTHLATTHAIDGRATYFCWRCQGTPS